jgi:polysaccharide deacetylase family protein (PEP-CTERM system associated)
MFNAFTVDVEDYFQVQAFARDIRREDWDGYELRVERNTDRILELLAEFGVRGTFFVLGWVADRCPELVRRIAAAGHEIGTHSYWHRLVYQLSPEEFRADLRQSISVIQELTGQAVALFRAPCWSITTKTPWAWEILREEGIVLDSSIFPIQHDIYGLPGSPRFPYKVVTAQGDIAEFPASTVRAFGMNLPVSGGGYFRLLPGFVTQRAFRALNRVNQPAVFYVHPWEIDPDQPRLAIGSWKSRFRHYTNLRSTHGKLRYLLASVPFTTLSETLAQVTERASRFRVDQASGHMESSLPSSTTPCVSPVS